MKPSIGFDALTLHAVADELRALVLGGRVQKVATLGPNTLGLELYARGARTNLLISAEPHAARVCVSRDRPARASETVTPLLLLLRKYVRDSRLEDLHQPPLERVLELRFRSPAAEQADASSGPGLVRLIIEVMGRRSNAVLVSEDGTIMDALRRASREKNPPRPILPRLRYDPPPPQDRVDPFATDTWETLHELRDRSPSQPLAELLSAHLRGFSPLLAREVAYRASGSIDVPSGQAEWTAVRASTVAILGPARGTAPWNPCLARWQGAIVALAAFQLSHLQGECELEYFDSISEAVEVAFGARGGQRNRTGSGATDALVRPILATIDARRTHVERRRWALRRARDDAGDPESLRQAGDLILSSLSAIREGQDVLRIDGQTIQLDPKQSGVENAQRFFREYRKARDANRRVPELLTRADRELEYLDDMRALSELAEDPGRLRAIRAELRASGLMDRPGQAPRPGKRRTDDAARPITTGIARGFTALIGTSARTNERVTFELAEQHDVWLHARQLPGAHVVVRTGGRQLPREVLLQAASLAAYYSQGRGAGHVPVDWTLCKYVRKIRGGPPGRVSYVNEQTLEVEPRNVVIPKRSDLPGTTFQTPGHVRGTERAQRG